MFYSRIAREIIFLIHTRLRSTVSTNFYRSACISKNHVPECLVALFPELRREERRWWRGPFLRRVVESEPTLLVPRPMVAAGTMTDASYTQPTRNSPPKRCFQDPYHPTTRLRCRSTKFWDFLIAKIPFSIRSINFYFVLIYKDCMNPYKLGKNAWLFIEY